MVTPIKFLNVFKELGQMECAGRTLLNAYCESGKLVGAIERERERARKGKMVRDRTYGTDE